MMANKDKFILEVCADSAESAAEAVKGGAMRLELCANLVIGGTTPSLHLFREIRKTSTIPMHILIRPRFGDFCFTDSEMSIMENEIKAFREEGAEGVVIGVLKPDGTLSTDGMKALCRAADGMHIALHRAFDMCKDPFATVEHAAELGVSTILTSGQQNRCIDGIELLKKLAVNSPVDIMAGGGVDADVIRKLRASTDITSFHLSGKITLDSPMKYRNPNVNMGLPSLSEFEIWRTDSKNIAAARKVLEMDD